MPSSGVGEEVRTSVRALTSTVDRRTAEEVALAMVAGAAQGFLDIIAANDGADGRATRLRLIRALPLDREEVLQGAADMRDS